MKNRLLKLFRIFPVVMAFSFLSLFAQGQDWERYDIDLSGCSAKFPYEPEWEFDYAVDSSFLWIGEVYDSDIYFGTICVEFAVPFTDEETSEDDLIAVAESYMDYLQTEFKITSHTGYKTGYWMESNDDATGISDSWTDDAGDPWLVMSWIDPFNMVVMYMYTGPDVPMEQYKDYFFNSFRFPDF